MTHPPSRRAIIHVGLPRSGTTTLQRILSTHRDALLEAGILYPRLAPTADPLPHLSHQHLGEALDGRRPVRDRTELLAELDRQLAATPADTLLLSYEGLCLAPPGAAALLAETCRQRGFAPMALATIKPPSEHLNSTYTWRTQFLREHRTFAAFVHAGTADRQLDLAALLDPWRAVCGGQLALVPVRDAQDPAPLVTRVLGAAGLLPRTAGLVTEADLAVFENRSPGPVVVEAARRLREGGAHRQLGPRAREATRFLEDSARAAGLDQVTFNGLAPALRASVDAHWHAANDRLAHAAWETPWASRVAPAPDRPVNELAGTPNPDVDALVAAACARFGLQLRPGKLGAILSALRLRPGIAARSS